MMWFQQLWKWNAPMKVKCLCGLVLENRIMLGIILLKEVDLDPYTALLRLFSSWDQGSFEECIQYWFSSDTKSLYFPLFFFWGYGDIVICIFLKMFNSILIGSVLVFVGCTMNFIETMRSKSRSPSLRPLSKDMYL